MILADDIFRSLTDRAPKMETQGKRAAERVPVTMQAAVVLIGGSDQTPLQSRVEDLSPVGIGLTLHRALAVGDNFAVRLRTQDGVVLWLVSRTARCLPRPNQEFLVGAHFVRMLQLNQTNPAVPTQSSTQNGMFTDDSEWGATG